MSERVFITGSNRGIGLELVREYLTKGARVFAACRQPESASDLQALKADYGDALNIVALSVDDDASLKACFEAVSAQTSALDVLINNAGIYPKTSASQVFGGLEVHPMREVLEVNSIAPVMVVQTFAPLLKAGNNPRLMMISSGMGSIGGVKSTNGMSYRMSKAALNMATRVLADALTPDGIISITTHPGWVQTDMGGKEASITPQESARDLIRIMDGLTVADNGKFFNHTGEELAW